MIVNNTIEHRLHKTHNTHKASKTKPVVTISMPMATQDNHTNIHTHTCACTVVHTIHGRNTHINTQTHIQMHTGTHMDTHVLSVYNKNNEMYTFHLFPLCTNIITKNRWVTNLSWTNRHVAQLCCNAL